MRRTILTVGLLLVASCGDDEDVVLPGSRAERDALAAGCEEPTDELLDDEGGMLPGRRCLYCHGAGGRAVEEEDDGELENLFTAAGTVFPAGTRECNAGGVRDVVVELLRADGSLQASARTGARGNFAVEAPLEFPLVARLRAGGAVREMKARAENGDCASCHDGRTTARLEAPAP